MKYVRFTFFLIAAVLLSFRCSVGQDAGREYVKWLEDRSMLAEARGLSERISGSGTQWRDPYALPQTEKIVETAPAWFVAYPAATITKNDESVLDALGDPVLWKTLGSMGFEAMHTGPVKEAGGLTGREHTPTVDGWFDRISFAISSDFGNEEQYRTMVANAAENGAVIVGDIIPGHTGKGADFRLAERGFKDYPGLYSMVLIDKEDWPLLPEVPEGADSVNLPSGTVDKLMAKGYIPGHLQRVLFSVPGRKGLTGWDATPPVEGADGTVRRWVYLHYFRPGQPTLNWLDPSFAANRLIAGDMIRTIYMLGAKIIRLDANSFLGIEIRPGDQKSWSEGHPLSVIASDNIAFLARKLGGWSFQELNLGLGDIGKFSRYGPDLSYDFITRPAYDHALLTGDASFLRLMLRLMRKYGIRPLQLIHAMQNHDEITYELVHFTEHPDETFNLGGERLKGKTLRDAVVAQMREKGTGKAAPYNHLSGNGLCTTYAGLCAAAFGVKDPYNMSGEEKDLVKKGHLLMALYNAMQPGVFAVSGWDLTGALPLRTTRIPGLLKDGDYRWVNRGAYDIMGVAPGRTESATGIPRAVALYGDLPSQLEDPRSFASGIRKMLEIRKTYKIHLAELIAVPDVKNAGVLIMVHRLPEGAGTEVTAINFGRKEVKETVTIKGAGNAEVTELMTEKKEERTGKDGELSIKLGPVEGKVLLLQ